MALLTPTKEEFARLLEQVRAESHIEPFGNLKPEGVAWLALVPVWTDALAHQVMLLTGKDSPFGELSVEKFVEAAQEEGLCQTRAYRANRTEYDTVEMLVSLAPHLDDAARESALKRVLALGDRRAVAQLLIQLVPALSPEHYPQLERVALDLQDPRESADLLIALLPRLQESARLDAKENALRAIARLEDAKARASAQLRLLPELTGEERECVVQEVLEAQRKEMDDETTSRVLSALAPYVQDRHLDAVQEVLAHIETPVMHANALGALAAQVQVQFETRRAWLQEAVTTVETLREGDERDRVLTTLAQAAVRLAGTAPDAQSKQQSLERAGVLANQVAGPEDSARAQALGILAQVCAQNDALGMSVGAAVNAVKIAQQLTFSPDNPGRRIEGVCQLTNLAAQWTAPQLEEHARSAADGAMAAAERVPHQVMLVTTFGVLADTFERLRRPQDAAYCRDLARRIGETREDPAEQVRALINLMPYAPETDGARQKLVERVMRLTKQVDDPEARQQILVNLVPYTQKDVRDVLVQDILNPPPPPLEFWMPDNVRASTLEELKTLEKPVDLIGLGLTLAIHLETLGATLPVPPATRKWAELASKLTPHESANVLDDHVVAALGYEDLAQATGWVNAGDFLTQTVKGELQNAVLLGHRRIELVYRQQQDERHLAAMLVRQPQVEAFDDLLNPSTPYWALHYIGLGGVGKTMLMRYLMSLMRARGIRAGRIDFDFLPPSFPVRKPGLLFGGLMDELQPQATADQQENIARQFRDQLITLHERLSDDTSRQALQASWQSTEFQETIKAFCDFVRTLPPPVILILDTCEELAKLQPDGAVLLGVTATFEIMERVREQVPSVRVLFAGRRFLAQAGFGWRVNPQDEGAGALQEKEKPYLALFEIRGFDREEALKFLRDKKKLQTTAEMEEAILKASPELGTVTREKPILWDPPRPVDTVARYNPYNLNLYADWLLETPTLTPQDLASDDKDPYIERRLVDRIRNADLRRALPTAALLGRFDALMLEPLFQERPGMAKEIWFEFAALEWTDQQGPFVEINTRIQQPLLNYFERQNPAALVQAKSDLVPWLDKRLADAARADLTLDKVSAALEDLTVEQVNAAMRLLPGVRAAELWDMLAFQTARAGTAGWEWIKPVADRLLGEGGAVDVAHPARANVRAAYISAGLHREHEYDATGDWTQVRADADREPNADTRERLKRRALLGRIAATRWNDRTLRPGELRILRQCMNAFSRSVTIPIPVAHDQDHSSLLATVEAIIERAEISGQAPPVPAQELASWAQGMEHSGAPRALWYFAYVLAARGLVLEHKLTDAAALLDTVKRALQEELPDGAQTWLDWRAPDSLVSRLRLEDARLRALVEPASINAEELAAQERDALQDLNPIDAERFVSGSLALRLARGLVPASELQELQTHDPYLVRRHVSNAHRVTAPLFANIALGWFALGETTRALMLLDERLAAAIKAGNDPVTVRAAEQTKLLLLRRLRSTNEPTLVDRYARSEDPEEVALAYPVMALTQSPDSATFLPGRQYRLIREDVREALRAHVYFRSTPAQRLLLTQSTYGFLRLSNAALNDLTTVEHPFIYHSLALDSTEYERVTDTTPFPRTLVNPEAWLQRHPSEIEQATRLALRQAALASTIPPRNSSTATFDPNSWAERNGARAFAELAQDEGELLALRLPDESIFVLNLASQWFERADDLAGQVRAATTEMLAAIRADHVDHAKGLFGNTLRTTFEELAHSTQEQGLVSWNTLLDRVLNQAQINTQYRAGADKSIGDAAVYAKSLVGSDWEERIVLGATRLATPINKNDLENLVARLTQRYTPSLPIELRVQPEPIRAHAETRKTARKPRAVAKPQIRIEISPDTSTNPDASPSYTLAPLTTLRAQVISADAGKSAPSPAEPVTSIGVAAMPGQQDYRTASARLPDTVSNHMKEVIASNPGKSRLEAALVIAPEAQELSWEAILTWNLQREALEKMLDKPRKWTAKLTDPLRWYRPGEAATTPLPAPGLPVVRALSSRRWSSHVNGGWAPFLASGGKIFWGDEAIAPDTFPLALHLMGLGVQTTAGVQIQQVDAAPLRKQAIQQSSTREELVSTDEVPFQNAALVVVEGEPHTRFAPRFESERHQANTLRAFASQVFRAGANAVLFLPSLPSPLVVPVLETIAEALQRTPRPKLNQLLDLREKVRRIILEWKNPDTEVQPTLRETQIEFALDVTLWARPEASAPGTALEFAPSQRTPQIQYISIPGDHVYPPIANTEPLVPEASYFRLWLVQCALGLESAWNGKVPIVSAQVTLRFENVREVTFSSIAIVPKQFDAPVRLNTRLSELLPYRGGIVSMSAALYALPEQKSLQTAFGVLSDLSQLVRVPLGNTLALAERLITGARDLIASTDSQIHLGWNASFVAKDQVDGVVLKPGYHALILSPQSEFQPDRLYVRDGLLVAGDDLKSAAPVAGIDFMLLHIEGRQEREDWQFGPIADAVKLATEALQRGNQDDFNLYRRMAQLAALQSPDLTEVDRRRIAALIRQSLQAQQENMKGVS